MTYRINNVKNPAAVLAIPEDADIDIVKEMIENEYSDVAAEYEHAPRDKMGEHVERKGSLMQELKAQLSQ